MLRMQNHGSGLEKEVQEEHVLDNKSLDLMIKTPEVRDEMEAEEERLPVMVAPGHIRFEPCDGGTTCTLLLQCPFAGQPCRLFLLLERLLSIVCEQ